jgi:hypothetical protein
MCIDTKNKLHHIIPALIISIVTTPIDIVLFGYSFAHGALGSILLYVVFRVIFVALFLHSLRKARETFFGMVIAGSIFGVIFFVIYSIIYTIFEVSLS